MISQICSILIANLSFLLQMKPWAQRSKSLVQDHTAKDTIKIRLKLSLGKGQSLPSCHSTPSVIYHCPPRPGFGLDPVWLLPEISTFSKTKSLSCLKRYRSSALSFWKSAQKRDWWCHWDASYFRPKKQSLRQGLGFTRFTKSEPRKQ